MCPPALSEHLHDLSLDAKMVADRGGASLLDEGLKKALNASLARSLYHPPHRTTSPDHTMSTMSALQNLPSTSTAFTATKQPRHLLSTYPKSKPASSSGHTVKYVTVSAPAHEVLLIIGRDPEVEVDEFDSSAIKLRFIEEAREMPVVQWGKVRVNAPVEKGKGREKEVVHVEDRTLTEKERPRKRPRKQV